MDDASFHISGELSPWPEKDHLALLLRDAGLIVRVGRYSLRVESCSHFVFQEYGGDIGEPSIDADADSLPKLLHDAKLVSHALTRARVRHRFELYDHHNNRVGYLHHDWPLSQNA